MKKESGTVLAGILLLLAILLRVLHIATLPLEMHIDEAGLGLNAWSIARFGTDRYGNFLPVCPSNFYGEQSALYTYFCALLVKLFGLNPYTLRLPGVILGVLTVLFGSLLMKEKWGGKGFYTGLALLAVFPYFIMNSRFALDCNAMLGAVTIALYSLLRLLKRAEQNPGRRMYAGFALTGLLFGVVLYTYIIAAVAVALFCLFFGVSYLFCKKEGRSLRFRQLIFLALPLLVLVIPPALVVCVNYFNWEPIATPFFSVPRMTVNRTQEVTLSLSALPGKLRALLYPLTTDGKYGSSDRYWTMYRHSVPLIAAGIFFSLRDALFGIKAQKIGPDLCMLFLAAAEVALFLFCGQYNYHINGIFIALAYFCVSGILSLTALFQKSLPRILFCLLLFVAYAGSFVGFSLEYYAAPPQGTRQVYGGAAEALSLLSDAQKEGEIYVLDEVGEFYFLSNPIPPRTFLAACDELGYVREYENLHFHEPQVFQESDVYVCSKASGRYYFFSDPTLLGHSCSVMETDWYYVFYPVESRD